VQVLLGSGLDFMVDCVLDREFERSSEAREKIPIVVHSLHEVEVSSVFLSDHLALYILGNCVFSVLIKKRRCVSIYVDNST
jgi:hypothetical protein